MTDEDLAVNFDLVASLKSDAPICFHMLPANEKQTQAALFDETLTQEFLPGLQIVWFSCAQAMWIIGRAKVLIERKIEKDVMEKRQVRLIKFVEIPGANHFVRVSSVAFDFRYPINPLIYTGALGRTREILGSYNGRCSQISKTLKRNLLEPCINNHSRISKLCRISAGIPIGQPIAEIAAFV
ncbi:hypothetical protein PILCRDRAFT_113025 [Piloderma croceum F 1598]|uniref:Uncharacterized protein n=1 Tax=Piloderma croceum (strain F 1598) TaxID=765440 RepID=A0A0C3CR73_PILCF|nr:hypothetical protein PILCRDRAFT_113025 [Piloderma croceum F 1598]